MRGRIGSNGWRVLLRQSPAWLAGLGLGFSNPAPAAPGDLDPTFGVAGLVTTDFSGTEDQSTGSAVQADGRIVAVGSTLLAGQFGAKDFALARYLHDGSLDPGFGTGGRVTTHFPSSFFSIATRVQIQVDGKIVVAGYSDSGLTPPGGFDQQFALARYLPDGSLDPSFGDGGLVLTDFGPYYDLALALTIQPDGKIVAAGVSYAGMSYIDPSAFALARYNPDGSLDDGFGTGGKVTTAINDQTDVAWSIAIDTAGRLVVGGTVFVGDGAFGIARYLPDGSLDTSFGSGGSVIDPFADAGFAQAEIAALTLQPDGKIVAAGRATPSSGAEALVVARYADDGSRDAGFGDGGVVDFSIGEADSEAYAVAIDRKGSILVAGQSGGFGFATVNGVAVSVDAAPLPAQFVLARLLGDGTPDAAFGNAGIVTTRFPGDDGIADVIGAIHPNANGILVSGLARTDNHAMSTYSSNADFALARYDDGYPIFADGFDGAVPGIEPARSAMRHASRKAAVAPVRSEWRDFACALLCVYREPVLSAFGRR
jgi:uncharacterized delta-60 repeat protein